MTTLSSYMSIARDTARWKSIAAKAPDVATQTRYFQDNIGKVKTADDLVNNSRLFAYAMKAFGLGDRTYAKGLMKQVLQQGVASSGALAHRTSAKRWSALFMRVALCGLENRKLPITHWSLPITLPGSQKRA